MVYPTVLKVVHPFSLNRDGPSGNDFPGTFRDSSFSWILSAQIADTN